MHRPNSIENRLEATVTDRVVSDQNEDVDVVATVYGFQEPFLGYHGLSGYDLGDIGVS